MYIYTHIYIYIYIHSRPVGVCPTLHSSEDSSHIYK